MQFVFLIRTLFLGTSKVLSINKGLLRWLYIDMEQHHVRISGSCLSALNVHLLYELIRPARYWREENGCRKTPFPRPIPHLSPASIRLLATLYVLLGNMYVGYKILRRLLEPFYAPHHQKGRKNRGEGWKPSETAREHAFLVWVPGFMMVTCEAVRLVNYTSGTPRLCVLCYISIAAEDKH